MRSILYLFFCILFYLTASSQSQVCVDSTSILNFQSKLILFSFKQITADDDNYYLKWDSASSSNGGSRNMLVKLNTDKQLMYRKCISQPTGFDNIDYSISHTNSLGELILGGGTRYNNIGQRSATLAKLSADGNMIWQKIYDDNSDINGFFFSQLSAGKNDDILAITENLASTRICRLDSGGNLFWAKELVTIPQGNELNTGIESILYEFHDNQISLAVTSTLDFYDLGGTKKSILSLVNLNYETGEIMQHKTYQFRESSPAWLHKENILKAFKYDAANQNYLLLSSDARNGNDTLRLLKFQNNFGFAGGASLAGDELTLQYNCVIDQNNETIICARKRLMTEPAIFFATINDNFNFLSQKKMLDPGFSGLYSGQFLNPQPLLQHKKMAGIVLNTYDNSEEDFVRIADANNNYINGTNCFLEDTVFLHKFLFNELFPASYLMTESNLFLPAPTTIPNAVMESMNLPTEKICTKVSVCDTIELLGDTRFCLSTDTISFSVYKNSQCLRKTQWKIDTTFARIISVTDTSIKLKFLGSFSTKIYAALVGCSLVDSLQIEVYAPENLMNLGEDKLICAGNSLLLQPQGNFKSYTWQDGSTDSTYTVVQPGLYFLTTIDYCNNIFTDSIYVREVDSIFEYNHTATTCQYDTVKILIDSSYSNLQIVPNYYASILNNTIYLYPQVTTVYTILADKIVGCHFTDTILIQKQPCPEEIYFPSAFTPNNDGLNDTYKPTVYGQLSYFDLSIYNRWGQMLFRTRSHTDGWNGLTKSGLSETGAYVWKCTYQFLGKPVSNKKGQFILIH